MEVIHTSYHLGSAVFPEGERRKSLSSFPLQAASEPSWAAGARPHLSPLSFPASLIGVEGGNATRIGRFANYLRNLLPSNDPVVMEMASKAIGRLAMAGDTFTAEYVEFEVKRALEWLGADRNEGRRHAAVSACGGAWHCVCRGPSHDVHGSTRDREGEGTLCFSVTLGSVLHPLSSP